MLASYRLFFVVPILTKYIINSGSYLSDFVAVVSTHGYERRVFRRFRIVSLSSGVVSIHAYRGWLRIVRFSLVPILKYYIIKSGSYFSDVCLKMSVRIVRFSLVPILNNYIINSVSHLSDFVGCCLYTGI